MNRTLCAAAWMAMSVLTHTTPADELPVVTPESVGMSSEALSKVDAKVSKLIEQQRLAGAQVLIARHGKVLYAKNFGLMDREAKKPMRDDTIFRIYSMTKSVTSAAALMVVDEGKLDLDAPVSQYIPKLKGMKVHTKGPEAAANRAMTVRDLFRHTAGMVYGNEHGDPVSVAYHKADVLNRDHNLERAMEKLSALPLSYAPGTDWIYGISVDVLGRVVEVVSEKPLDEFFEERLFKPLDMRDTGFHVPREKLDRFAANYTSDGKGKLTLRDAPAESRYLTKPKLFSGGGGLVSTGRDYLRFLVMIQNGGEFAGERLLSKKSVELMTTNQLSKQVGWISFGEQVREGVGFGLGFSVRVKMSRWDANGRVGEYGWGGAASTHYWISPKDDLVVVTMEQTMPYSFMLETALKGPIYKAVRVDN